MPQLPRGTAEDKAMMLDPSRWPYKFAYLFVKRYLKLGKAPQCGIIGKGETTVREFQPGKRVGNSDVIKEYASVDAMIADGWMVD
jgi:hypothetical protein